MLGLALTAGSASAQQYEPELRGMDLVNDVARSPRLLALGRLSLVVPDGSNSLGLWDFAANPIGILTDDSVSTVELRSLAGTLSQVRDDRATGLERQSLAGQDVGLPFEAWHREAASGSAYGLAGAFSSLRADREMGSDLERRRSISLPEATPIIAGRMPLFLRDRMRYALRFTFANERLRDEFRAFTTNAAGSWIDGDGEFRLSPNTFDPDERERRTQGAGLHLGYSLASGWMITAGADFLRHRLHFANEDNRYSSNINEDRGVGVGEATLVGRLGPNLQWITDAQGWTSSSEQRWLYTIAGSVGQAPLVGRGKLLEREELGSSLRSRALWTQGALALGASVDTRFDRVTVTPPDPSDASSLNHFLNTIYRSRQNSDSLALPDSVIANRSEARGLGFGLGASLRFARGIVGVEFHRGRDVGQQDVGGVGPRPVSWDVRTGVEYHCTPLITGRLGWVHRRVDQDEFVALDEFVQNTGSLGLGLSPAGTRWTVDAAYGLQWEQADFGDPTVPRAARQSASALVRWSF